MTQRLTTKLVKELHRSKVREALEADECASEAEALLQLRALQLDHQGLEAIDGLEPFDRCEELYLDHNSIRIIQNLEFLRRLRVLSLSWNQIEFVGSSLVHLHDLRVLDLSHNNIEGAVVEGASGLPLSAALPRSLRVLDLRGNPCASASSPAAATSAAGELRRALVKALEFVQEVDGSAVGLEERRSVLGKEGLEKWGRGPAGRTHAIYIPLKAEFEYEVDRTVKFEFRTGDDLGELVPAFCAKHGVGHASDVEALLAEASALVNEKPAAQAEAATAARGSKLRPFAVGHNSGSSGSSGSRKAGGGGGAEGGEEAFRRRLVAFYEAHDPAKASRVDQVMEKYGATPQSRGKLLQALVDKYGPEPSQTGLEVSEKEKGGASQLKSEEKVLDFVESEAAKRARARLTQLEERRRARAAAQAAAFAAERAARSAALGAGLESLRAGRSEASEFRAKRRADALAKVESDLRFATDDAGAFSILGADLPSDSDRTAPLSLAQVTARTHAPVGAMELGVGE